MTESDSSLNELEDKFNKIDSEIDALRSEIDHDDNDFDDATIETLDTIDISAMKTALAEKSADEMEQIVNSMKEQRGSENSGAPKANDTPKKASSSPMMYLLIALPILLAFVVGQKFSSSPVPTGEDGTSVNIEVKTEPQVKYEQKRKVERCKYVNGEKYCESEEESTSSSSPGSGGQPRLNRQATFQKCHYANGESYCESFQQSVSGDAGGAQKLTRNELTAEFQDADTNGDGQVSKPEFERYKQIYLQQYPEAANSFARFEEFDRDSSGLITVNEHEGYYKGLGLL